MSTSSAASPSTPAPAPDSPEVQVLVERINGYLAKGIEAAMRAGTELIGLVGYAGKPGLVRVKKAEYPRLGLHCGYSWHKALMQIAMAPHLQNRENWDKLPVAITPLLECAKMTPDRFAEGLVEPRAGKAAIIHPLAKREDLRAFGQRGQRGKKSAAPPRMATQVLLIYVPLTDADAADPVAAINQYVEQFMEHAVSVGARLGVGFAVSRRVVEDEAGPITRIGVEQFREYDENGNLLKPEKQKGPARWTDEPPAEGGDHTGRSAKPPETRQR